MKDEQVEKILVALSESKNQKTGVWDYITRGLVSLITAILMGVSVYLIGLGSNQQLTDQKVDSYIITQQEWAAADRREKTEYRERLDDKFINLRNDFNNRMIAAEKDLEEPRFGEAYYKNAYHTPLVNAVNSNTEAAKDNAKTINELKSLINEVQQDTRFIRLKVGKENKL